MVWEQTGKRGYPGAAYPRVAAGSGGVARRVLLGMALAGIAGKTVLSATLSARVRVTSDLPWSAGQTLSLTPLAKAWSVAKTTWANQPSTTGAAMTAAPGARTDGQRVEFDVTGYVQAVANGQAHYGWRLSSTGAGAFYGFARGDAWTLTVETSEAPQQPTTLRPEGAIGRARWVVVTDFTDNGSSSGDSSVAAMQVQVDPNQNGTTPGWDSGAQPVTLPQLDLAALPVAPAAGQYPGLAAGASTSWRVRVRDNDGYWSDWSDWVQVTRVPKPPLTLDEPSGGVLFDPTVTVQAHLEPVAGGDASPVVTSAQVRVTDGDDRTRVLYDSGRVPGDGDATLAVALPDRTRDGSTIFTDGGTCQLHTRAWDRLDRVQGGPDDPPYVERWDTVVFDSDAVLTPPAGLEVTQPVPDRPGGRLRWFRDGAADGWVVTRDGVVVARLTPTDVQVDSGQYEWTDNDAEPNSPHTWGVAAIVNGCRTTPTTYQGLLLVTGVWLISAEHGDVCLDGNDFSGLTHEDRRATYSLPFRPDDVDIVGALGVLGGTFTGDLFDDTNTHTVNQARARLEAMRRDPSTPVRLSYGTTSVMVRLRNVSVTPHDDLLPEFNQWHKVSFGCYQVGEPSPVQNNGDTPRTQKYVDRAHRLDGYQDRAQRLGS